MTKQFADRPRPVSNGVKFLSMTLFGKVLLGVILATAGFLIVRGAIKSDDMALEEAGEIPVATAPETESVEEASVFSGSAKELMARGGNNKCTFTQEVENSKSTGTVYISGQKLRGDFKSDVTAAGVNMSVESYMISDGEFMYTWSSMMPTGFKVKIVDTSATATTAPSSQQSFDSNQKLEYSCVSWTPDESQFMLPATITFKEI